MINSVYIHYPFCLRKCGYCSFFSVEQTEKTQETYLNHLCKEISLYSALLDIKPHTFYLGGGTPSLIEPGQLRKIFDLFDLSELKECTIEINPATVDKKKLRAYMELSINRLNLGMQSFVDSELEFLGRTHKSKDNISVFNLARDCGYDNISLDLIYGLPGQTRKDLSRSLEAILRLRPEHISTYCLSLEDDAPLSKQSIELPADEISADFYRYIQDKLSEAGFDQYEISNFSRASAPESKVKKKKPVKRGYMSQHNLSYWQNQQYIGFGCSAHSLIDDYRCFNPSDLGSYFSLIRKQLLFPEKEKQDTTKRKKDLVIQSLRLAQGLDINRYNVSFNEDFLRHFQQSIAKHRKLLTIKDGFIKIKPENYFVSNEIIMDFID